VFAAVIFFPATYAVKFLFGLEMTWVDPAFIAGALALIVYVVRTRGRLAFRRDERGIAVSGAVFLGVYCLGGIVSLLRYTGTHSTISPTTYACLRDPAWLAFCMALFYLVLLAVNDQRFYLSILKLFVWVGIGEFLLAAYMVIALAKGWYLPSEWAGYMEAYYWRQAVYQGGFVVPRLGGTFVEAPIYGLFMLCSLASNLLLLRLSSVRLYRVTRLILLFGTIASLSDQVLLGLAALPVIVYLPNAFEHARRRPLALAGGLAATLVLATWLGISIQRKSVSEMHNYRAGGQSIADRVYHTVYGLGWLEKHPFLGIGPGLYGYYAEKTGIFPHTATVMATVPEILIETGPIGLASFLLFVVVLGRWLWRKRDGLGLGVVFSLLIASSLQSNWRWGFVYFTFGLAVACYRFEPARGTA